jgi:hypothetical protein
MPAKVYSDKDADLGVLKNKTLAVLGFGSQGHAHALNLKDSGLQVIIGLYEGSKSIPVAKSKGFEVVTTAEAVRRADVIFVALPDTKQAAALQKRHRAESDQGQDAAVLARFLDPFQNHRSAEKRERHHGRAQRPRPHRPPPIHRRQGRARLIAVYQGPPARTPKRSRSPGPRASAAPAPACSKPISRKKPKPICSANRPCLCGGASAPRAGRV